MKAVYMDKRGVMHSTGEKPQCLICGVETLLAWYNFDGPWCLEHFKEGVRSLEEKANG
jgi:hypothetical protein